ncbi:response regulator [Candidatus Woesebacteria bacterium]|nr:response regulator [Candidatus Woesebacteria bacterium]MCD8507337.1 response regulator [Candidatus Woesebacteria bacterium]MCD8527584.1 response regulator [Candidatus Woesebacteria bacterium]MCD8546444.1 response regulator [Candidatus Woesebacteria bacterium]
MENRETLHLLVVDDNFDEVEIFEEFLRFLLDSLGITVVVTLIDNYREALAAIQNRTIHPQTTAVLFDGQLGHSDHGYTDGETLITQFNAIPEYAHIHRIGISNTSGKPSGADAYYTKNELVNPDKIKSFYKFIQQPRQTR